MIRCVDSTCQIHNHWHYLGSAGCSGHIRNVNPAPVAPAPAAQDEETCNWHLDDNEFGVVWETECDQEFQFETGGVEENQFRFCYYCGKKITVTRASVESLPIE